MQLIFLFSIYFSSDEDASDRLSLVSSMTWQLITHVQRDSLATKKKSASLSDLYLHVVDSFFKSK